MYELSALHLGAVVGALVVVLVVVLATGIRRVGAHERGVVFRSGAFHTTKGPGWILVLPSLERLTRVDMRAHEIELPLQGVTTSDDVSVDVTATLSFHVDDPALAVLNVDDHRHATATVARTALRESLGRHTLSQLRENGQADSAACRDLMVEATAMWGVDVSLVRIDTREVGPT